MVKDLIPKVNGISIVKKIKDVKNLYKMKLPKKKLKELLTRCQKDLVEMLINTNNLFPKEMIRRVGKLWDNIAHKIILNGNVIRNNNQALNLAKKRIELKN